MSAYKGPYSGAEGMSPRYDAPVWEQTPWWNWHRLFGLDLRRPQAGVGWSKGLAWDKSLMSRHGQWWEYGNSKKVARNVLSSLYDPLDGYVMQHTQPRRYKK
jgi:hypothetical protein